MYFYFVVVCVYVRECYDQLLNIHFTRSTLNVMAAFSSNATDVLERSVDAKECVALGQVWNEKKLQEITTWTESNNLQRICLQFPDDLLQYSVGICAELQTKQPSCEYFILADTTYCPCCVDEVGAEHISASGLVHFGPACLTRPHMGRLKVLYMFTEEQFSESRFRNELKSTFPDPSTRIALFYTTGVVSQLNEIKEALQEYPFAIVARLAIDGEADVLNWSTGGQKELTEFACIYIGQDDQTLFNLSVSVAAKQWLLFDTLKDTLKEHPLAGSVWLRKRMFYIEKCKDAQTLGIVHGTVSSKGHLDISNRIQTLAKAHGIRTILISVGKLNPAKLANFMEIDCFVLIGCPQNNMYTSREFYKPLISVFECELALNPVWREKLPTTYSMDFKEMLPEGKHFSDVGDVGERVHGNDTSLITGSVRGRGSKEVTSDHTTTDLMHRTENAIAERTAGDALRERTWRGLEQNLGQDEVADIQQGRSGIAIRYEENPVE